jgi:hypothetical protein
MWMMSFVEGLEGVSCWRDPYVSETNVSVPQVKGADFRVLESYCRFVITAAKALEINIGGR